MGLCGYMHAYQYRRAGTNDKQNEKEKGQRKEREDQQCLVKVSSGSIHSPLLELKESRTCHTQSNKADTCPNFQHSLKFSIEITALYQTLGKKLKNKRKILLLSHFFCRYG